MEIILASSSPKRKELLKKIIKNFRTLPSGIEEEIIEENDVVKTVENLALKKAQKVAERYPDALIIGGDTMVEKDGKIYGKPKNDEEAIRILKNLRGSRHRVITGVAVVCKNRDIHLVDCEVSYVRMKDDITNKEIEDYVKSGRGKNKAGGYRGEEKDNRFIEQIEGDYDNVVGLPLKKLSQLLTKTKIKWI